MAYLIPYSCVICRLPSKNHLDLCLQCEQDLPYAKKSCTLCGTKLVEEENTKVCGSCLTNPPPWHQLKSLLYYQPPIDRLITGLKFHDKLIYANLLGRLFGAKLQQEYSHTKPEAIIPVPLHPLRLQERGFNQALELARPIAKILGVKIDYNYCKRIKYTEPQSNLSANKRINNTKKSFAVPKKAAYQHVAILDDVITTGSTMQELCKTIRKAGVKKIDVWCLAKT